MARIELRHTIVSLRDGLAGTALVDAPDPPLEGDTELDLKSVTLNTAVTTLVPVGARFKIDGETDEDAVHVVTGRTPSDEGPTATITFTPALGPGTYADEGELTFLPQQVDIKIGEGNISYTEHNEYEYLLDRGDLDTVREGDQVPMDVNLDCVYEHITTGTGEPISPLDALKGVGAAEEWVSSSQDPCEPYAVDLVVLHEPPCGPAQPEKTTFPDFRAESREINFEDATISVQGRCNVVEPIVERL